MPTKPKTCRPVIVPTASTASNRPGFDLYLVRRCALGHAVMWCFPDKITADSRTGGVLIAFGEIHNPPYDPPNYVDVYVSTWYRGKWLVAAEEAADRTTCWSEPFPSVGLT